MGGLVCQMAADRTPVVVNLASEEYFKAVDLKALKAQVVECVFQEYKDGQYKIVSFFAKRARGLMARYGRTTDIADVRADSTAVATAATPQHSWWRRFLLQVLGATALLAAQRGWDVALNYARDAAAAGAWEGGR